MCSESNHLYSILSNESPTMHAECFKSIPPKELVCKYNKDKMLLYSVKQWVQLFLSIKEEGHQKKYVTP